MQPAVLHLRVGPARVGLALAVDDGDLPLAVLAEAEADLDRVAPRVRKPGAAVPAAVEEVHRLVVLVRQLHGIALLRGFLGGFRLGLFLLRRGLFFLGFRFGLGLRLLLGNGGQIAEQIAQILGRLGGRFHFGFLDDGRRGGLASFGALLGRLAQDFKFGAQSRQIRFGRATFSILGLNGCAADKTDV